MKTKSKILKSGCFSRMRCDSIEIVTETINGEEITAINIKIGGMSKQYLDNENYDKLNKVLYKNNKPEKIILINKEDFDEFIQEEKLKQYDLD